jgi:hypothetical protein
VKGKVQVDRILSPKRRKARYSNPAYGAQQLGVTGFTVTEKLQQQQRFFCENCKQEVFLQAKYCDNCGGQIEWPEKIQKAIAFWKPIKNEKEKK